MAFQFSCPQGHLLNGDESQIGQACQCPYCGSAFLVPAPAASGAVGMMGGFPRPNREPPMQPFQAPGASSGIPVAPRPQYEMPSASPPSYPAPGFPQAQVPQAPPLPPEPAGGASSAFELPAVKPFDLGFDPTEKNPLPFELPGSDAAFSFDSSPPTSSDSFPFGSSPPNPSEGYPVGPPDGPAYEPEPDDAGTGPVEELAIGEPAAAEYAQGTATEEAAGESAGGLDFDALTSEERPAVPRMSQEEFEVFHIPCPSGHVVAVGRKLLGKTAICSLCRQKFVLRYEKSAEYRDQAALQLEKREEKVGHLWLAWSLAVGVFVIIGVIILVFTLSGR
jgi:hypothetical protein